MNFSEHDTMGEQSDDSLASDTGNERHMTLSSGEFDDQEPAISFEEKPKLKVNSGAMLIVVVAAIAAAGLFSMRTLTRASAAIDAPTAIEESIDEFLSVVMNRSGMSSGPDEGILDVLSESYTLRQVPLEEVQRNPFIIFEPVFSKEPVAAPSSDPLATRRAMRTSDFEKASGELRVGMILMGDQPMANVNKRIVRVGDVVPVDPDVEFRVVSITADRVRFLARDAELGVEHEWTVKLRRE